MSRVGNFYYFATEEIRNFFEEDSDALTAVLEELDGWNGFLGDDRYYPMEDLDEIFSDDTPINILLRAFFGHDEDNYTTDSSGERHYSDFNPNRDYFRFNGYGNLVSTDYIDYSDHNDSYTIIEMLDNRSHLDTINDDPDLSEMFDRLQEEIDALDQNGKKEGVA